MGNKKVWLYFFYPCLDCHFPHQKADGVCDDENNIEECEYDGGDCCGSKVQIGFCSECECLDPNHQGKWEKLKDEI